jgi:hypothetical protein
VTNKLKFLKSLLSFPAQKKKPVLPAQEIDFLNQLKKGIPFPLKARFEILNSPLFEASAPPTFHILTSQRVEVKDPSSLGILKIYGLMELIFKGKAYCLLARWDEDNLEKIYFGFSPFGCGTRQDLINRGLARLFEAPEQPDYVPAHLDYALTVPLASSLFGFQAEKEVPQEPLVFSSLFTHSLLAAEKDSQGIQETPFHWREYELLDSQNLAEFRHLFLWEKDFLSPSGDWHKEGGKLILWVTKEIQEQDVRISLP